MVDVIVVGGGPTGLILAGELRSRPAAGTAGMDSLTGRELQVARLILGRRSNFEIRAELFLSGKTVETHVRNVGDRVGLVPRVPRRDPEHRESRPTA